MPTHSPSKAARPGLHARGAAARGRRAADLRLWLLVTLMLMLVLVKSVDLHFHGHIGAPTSAMHLADASTAHDAGHGDLDIDIQGQGSLHQLPSIDLLPMLLLALPLLVTLAADAERPRRTAADEAAPPPWRHRANTTPPSAGPPLH